MTHFITGRTRMLRTYILSILPQSVVANLSDTDHAKRKLYVRNFYVRRGYRRVQHATSVSL